MKPGASSRWRHCGLATLLALPALAVLIFTDSALKSASGFGVMDLQHAQSAEQAGNIVSTWRSSQGAELLAGFSTGFDFLFVALYGYALWTGALAARDSFAPDPGSLRLALTIIFWSVPACIVLDAAENVYTLRLLSDQNLGAIPDLMRLTSVKWVFAYLSMSYVALAAIAARFGLFGSRKRNTG